jgi:hypothetical protein
MQTSNSRRTAELIAVLYISGITFAANKSHLSYLLFPELGALAMDMLVRPRGSWARDPLRLILTPALTAAIGIVVGQFLPYGVFAILLTLALSIGLILAMRSSVAPAISAGVLPLVLDVRSWLYPISIFFGLIVLTGILWLWKRSGASTDLMRERDEEAAAIEILESGAHDRTWFLALFAFTAVIGTAAQVTGLRFILFPPLVVMAYEMLKMNMPSGLTAPSRTQTRTRGSHGRSALGLGIRASRRMDWCCSASQSCCLTTFTSPCTK